MSDYEQHNGKAKFTEAADEAGLEELCKSICKANDFTKNDYHDSYREQLEDDGYRKYIIVDTGCFGVYEIIGDSAIEDHEDIFEATPNEDGTINFILRYYNGGCSFTTAFEAAIDNMKSSS